MTYSVQTPATLLVRVGRHAVWLALLLLTACQNPGVSLTEPPAEGAPGELINLNLSEREHLRAGMRAYLDALHGIAAALEDHDRKAIAKHAREVGVGSVNGVSPLTVTKLPPQFLMLATDTHQKFDTLADLASGQAGQQKLMAQLSDILGNCAACHATYGLAQR